MRKPLLLGLSLIVAGCAAFAFGAPLHGPPPLQSELLSYGGDRFPVVFRGGERAVVVVQGNHQTYLGLYVFDEEGNCVAHDDLGNQSSPDDLAVEWVPARTGRYWIEVHNFGLRRNTFEVAFR
jgi:hypothetical protein